MSAAELPKNLTDRLRSELGFELASATPIDAGVVHNNKLLRLRARDGRELIAKLYFVRDDRDRLGREFRGFEFLRGQGFTTVPSPYLRDDDARYAVYSFEPGSTRTPAELSLDDLAAIGRFAGELHRLPPGLPGADFPRAFAARSLAERVEFARRRLRTFLDYASSPGVHPAVAALIEELDVKAEIESLLDGAVAGLSPAELAAELPEASLRLYPGDFAPHNVIFRPDGTICAIDFEYICWDDPAVAPAAFLAADQTLDLTAAQADAFLTAYHATCGLPASAFARMPHLRALLEVGWALTNLSLLTPAHIARKQFDAALDLPTYLAGRIALFRRRLVQAQSIVAALPRA